MEILMKGYKSVYRFACPACKSKLETGEYEIVQIAPGIFGFECLGCLQKRCITDNELFIKRTFVNEK